MFNKRILLGIVILVLIIGSAAGIKVYMHRAFAAEVGRIFEGVPGMTCGDRTSSYWKDEVTCRDARFDFASAAVRADEIVIYSDEGPPQRPRRMHAKAAGFVIDLNDSNDEGAIIRGFGIDRLQGSLEMDAETSYDLKELQLQFQVSFDQLFALKASLHAYDLQTSSFRDAVKKMASGENVPIEARIASLSFRLQDLSLIKRLLEGQPLQPEMTVLAALAQMPRLQHISGFREAATAFLAKPAQLEFVIAPEQPIPFADLQKIAAQEPQRLNMRLQYYE